MKLRRSLARSELDLNCPLATALSARSGRRQRHFLDRVGLRLNVSKEPVGVLQQWILNVYAIERDIDRVLGETVDRRRARASDRRCSGQVNYKVERISRGERQICNLATG